MIDFKTFLQCASDTIYNLIKEREGRPINKSSYLCIFLVFLDQFQEGEILTELLLKM